MVQLDCVLDDGHRETVAVRFRISHGRSAYTDPMKATQPQRLMVSREHGFGEVIELTPTLQTVVSLSGTLTLVPPLSDDSVCVAVRTPYPPRPAVGPNHLKTLVVVQQVQQVHSQSILPPPTRLPEIQEEPCSKLPPYCLS